MNRYQIVTSSCLILVSILLAACSSQQSPVGSQGGEVTDFGSLVDTLRATGAVVDPAGDVSQPFFIPEGQVLTINDRDAQVFEFSSAADARAAAETISADGSSVGTTMVTWIAEPHFYEAGKLIVLYVGEDSDVIGVLEAVVGPQLAGR